jgi:hypothetical protein
VRHIYFFNPPNSRFVIPTPSMPIPVMANLTHSHPPHAITQRWRICDCESRPREDDETHER